MNTPTVVIQAAEFDQYLRILGDLSSPSMLHLHNAFVEAWFSGIAEVRHEYNEPSPETELPEITLDADGFSQPLVDWTTGETFHIARVGSLYYLANAQRASLTVCMTFGGALCVARRRVVPGSYDDASKRLDRIIAEENAKPLTPDTITDGDRRTNYGAF